MNICGWPPPTSHPPGVIYINVPGLLKLSLAMSIHILYFSLVAGTVILLQFNTSYSLEAL